VSEERKTKDRMPLYYVPAWSSRSVSYAVDVVILMQITYYATDVMGLSAGLIGTLLLASKLFDGFTDLVVGYFINKTNTRLGKARPYELMIIPLWVFTILLYSTPNLGTSGKAAYIFVFYTLIQSVFATFLNGTDAIYMGRAISNDQHRARVISLSAFIVMFFAGAASIMLPQLMKTWGVQEGGWTKIALVFGGPMLIAGMCRFFFLKEVNVNPEQEAKSAGLGLRESLLTLAKNKYSFILAGCLLLVSLVQGLLSIVGTYYFRYVMGNLGLLSILGLFGLAAPLVMLLFPLVMRKLGAMNFIRIGLVLAFLGNILIFFSGANIPLVFVGQFCASLGTAPLGILANLFLIQCMDYSEWKTGKRVDGFVTAMNNFSKKVGGGIASGGVGLIMAAAGYDGTLAVQSGSALGSILMLYSLVPAVICMLAFILARFYDLDKRIPHIKAELAKSRTQV
jgi:GPH family glycoside/pentoside/hexuronide:cation symporter